MNNRRMAIVGGVVVVALAAGAMWIWFSGGQRLERLASSQLWSQVEEVLDGPVAEERRAPIVGIAALLPVSRTDATLLRWYSSPVNALETTLRVMHATGMTNRSDADLSEERDWYDFGGYVDHDAGQWYVVINVYEVTSERLRTRDAPPVPAGAVTLVSVRLSEER